MEKERGGMDSPHTNTHIQQGRQCVYCCLEPVQALSRAIPWACAKWHLTGGGEKDETNQSCQSSFLAVSVMLHQVRWCLKNLQHACDSTIGACHRSALKVALRGHKPLEESSAENKVKLSHAIHNTIGLIW